MSYSPKITIPGLPTQQLKKIRIAGQTQVVDSLLKRVVLLNRETMQLIAARNVASDNTWELFAPDQGDENHILIGMDEGGNFNVDAFDKASLGVKTFSVDPADYADVLSNAEAFYVASVEYIDFSPLPAPVFLPGSLEAKETRADLYFVEDSALKGHFEDGAGNPVMVGSGTANSDIKEGTILTVNGVDTIVEAISDQGNGDETIDISVSLGLLPDTTPAQVTHIANAFVQSETIKTIEDCVVTYSSDFKGFSPFYNAALNSLDFDKKTNLRLVPLTLIETNPIYFEIPAGTVDEDLQNVQIPIDLSPYSEIFSTVSGISEISVLFQDGQFLNVEVESWNTSLEKGILWVSLPYVSSDSSTYYAVVYPYDAEKTGAPVDDLAHAVWDNFLFVYHMSNDPVGTDSCIDSTVNNNLATTLNMAPSNKSHALLSAYEYSYDGADKYINAGNLLPEKTIAGAMEIVFKTAVNTGFLVSQDADGWNDRDTNIAIGKPTGISNTVTDGHLVFEAKGPEMSETNHVVSTAPVNDNAYHHAALSWYRNNFGLTLDGVIDVPQIEYKMWGADGSTDIQIGSDGTGFFNGSINDVMVSKKFQSTDWHEMLNKSLNDSLLEYELALWTPLEITSTLWLDAADSDTLTLDANNRVSLWSDKSGNGYDANERASGNGPVVLSAEQNGLNVLYSSGTPYGMTISSPIVAGSANRSIFIVGKHAGAGKDSGSSILSFGEDDSVTTGCMFQITCELGIRVRNGNRIFSTAAPSNYFLLDFLSTNGSTTGLSGYLNGTALPVSSTVAATLTTSGDSSLFYKHLVDGSYEFPDDITICEIIVFASELSTANRQKIEGYLTHKWGLDDNLPSDHPYKNTPPISDITQSNVIFTATKKMENFPVKIDLSATSGSSDEIDLASIVISNNANILVSHNAEQVKAEVAYWDIGVRGIIWALIPEVIEGKNILNIMDNEEAASTTGVIGSTIGQEVWQDFEAVYHLCQDPAVAIKDSTGNHANAVPTNMDATNLVDGAIVFNGTDEAINIGNIFDTQQDQGQIHVGFKTAVNSGVILSQGDSDITLDASGNLVVSGTQTEISLDVLSDNVWHGATFAFHRGKRDFFVDGVDQIPYGLFGSTGTADVLIGGHYTVGAAFTGNIVDVRLNNDDPGHQALSLRGKVWKETLEPYTDIIDMIPVFSFEDVANTYKIWDGAAWRAVISKDDAVHGATGDTDWHYRDGADVWSKVDAINFTEAAEKAIAYPENQNDTLTIEALTSAEWTSTGGMTSDGYFNMAFVFSSPIDNLYPAIENVYADDARQIFSDAVNLEPYNGKIAGSKIEWSIKITDSSYDYSQVKVYACLTGGTWTECTRNEAIPGITAGMDTTGVNLQFKITTPLDYPDESKIILTPKIN